MESTRSFGGTKESRTAYVDYLKEIDSVDDSAKYKSVKLAERPVEQLRRYGYCYNNGVDKPDAQFKYCSICRKIPYCSKECQELHWRDHKLVCKKPK